MEQFSALHELIFKMMVESKIYLTIVTTFIDALRITRCSNKVKDDYNVTCLSLLQMATTFNLQGCYLDVGCSHNLS